MNRALRRETLSTEQSNRAAISMSCTSSAAYRIILARCTVRNGNVTVDALRSSSSRSSPVSSITYVLILGTTHNSARFCAPRVIPSDTPQDQRTRPLVAVPSRGSSVELAFIDQLVDRLAVRFVALLGERRPDDADRRDEWLDSRHAADYLGVHRDTLRKLAAERAIPSEQDGPGCKLYFRRSDLDVWRRGGGRPRHLASVVANAA
jgi:excisionase family DNA binding protein